ncbi:MAG: hypothetical protein Roseis2KO_49860 [Roseivirga sp.]
MGDIYIKQLDKGDYEAFAELRTLGLATDPQAFWASKEEEGPELKQKFADRIAHPFNFSLGAFVSGQLVGIMSFNRYGQYKLSFKGDIVGVYVHPDFRGMKIGDQLLAATIEKAFAIEGVTKLTLTVTASNTTAKGLYEKYGFIEYGFEKRGMRVGDTYYDQFFMHLEKENRK